ncbi:MAG: MCE family protein [Proteobacteria bacterium]|nr:MCE family protein [Pseudomonadota bacterium]MBU1388387.1 MCE family protein [Pseudomonadota bacterium]MBU1542789.1 MCE family protein [Pseudomonadota bacterium]MBU2481317.1 MCE family protein [Pseudomonadota bacterium]
MTQKANFYKLGLFVILSLGLGATFLIVFGAGEFFKTELLAETCFNESVQGLSIGSEVKYKGIKIGTVKSIESAARTYQTKSDYVLVILSLDSEISLGQTGETAKIRVEKAISDGLAARLSFKGLTGAAYLETDYGSQKPEDTLKISWSPRYIYIPSQKSNMKQFGDAANQILDNFAAINLKGMTLDIESLLKTLNTKASDFDVAKISNLIASLVQELKETNQKVNTAMESAKVQGLIDDARASFSQLRGVIETSKDPFNQAISDFQKAAESTQNMTSGLETQLGPRLENLSANLDQLMKNLSQTSGLLENMVWLNSDKIERIVENLETTSENLKQMSKDLKRYPGRLLFEKPPEKTPMGGKTDDR